VGTNRTRLEWVRDNDITLDGRDKHAGDYFACQYEANKLNRQGVPCPSARRPDQNRHRLADGWQGSTVRSILENPRYTGYAIFGRWTKQETRLDPDDVGAGHVVRFRRASAERVVRSRQPAHPAVVSVEDFTQRVTKGRTCFVGISGARPVGGRWRAVRVLTGCTTGAQRERWPRRACIGNTSAHGVRPRGTTAGAGQWLDWDFVRSGHCGSNRERARAVARWNCAVW
jgi:hypothetical protein